jgi:hypothetical protein
LQAAAERERLRLERKARRAYDDEIEDDNGGGWFQEGRMANVKVRSGLRASPGPVTSGTSNALRFAAVEHGVSVVSGLQVLDKDDGTYDIQYTIRRPGRYRLKVWHHHER